MITRYPGDTKPGDRHVSRARAITGTDPVAFAMVTGDWHPIHTAAGYAAADPVYQGRIGRGTPVLSFALGLGGFRPPAMKAFYGIGRPRFVAPARIGGTIHVKTEVIAVDPRAGCTGAVTSRFTVRSKRSEDVLVATVKSPVAEEPR